MSASGRRGVPSRSQQAFSWLLSAEPDETAAGRGRQGGSKGGKGKGRRGSGGGDAGTSYIPGFRLREGAAAGARSPAAGRAAGASGLAALQESFEGVLDREVVADVLASCGGDAAAAMDALLTLAGGSSSAAAQPADAAPPGVAAAGDARPGTATAAAGPPPTPAHPAQPCYWDALPTECKWLVFEELSLRDLARAARTCREFAAYVREQRRSLPTVVVPEGVSLTAVRSLVAAFGGARGVSLWRCAAALRFQHEFEDMLRAVALGQSDRPSGVPVSQLSLARCGGATDGVVAALCETFSGLRRLDLSRCVGVGDAAMVRPSAYTRQPDAAAGSEEEEEEGAWEQKDAAAGVGGMRLSGSPPPAAAALAPAPVPAMESPDSAVRRIAAQRHADMLERCAAAARAQHGRPTAGGLEELCLRETSVGGRGLRQLLQPGSATSKSLKVLDVSRCANLGSDLDLQPRAMVEVLRAGGCASLRCVAIQLPAEAPLRALHLDGCRQLAEVLVVASRLESLNLSHCGQLRSLTLRCRRLRELRAVNCSSLTLSAGELRCPALEEVNLFGCRQLDAEGLEACAASLTKCFSLDLTGCISLPRLLLPEATALRTVSVSGCSLLRQVLLASPLLCHFRAAGCARLMDVRLGTATLSQLDLENCCNLREVQLSEDVGGGAAAPEAARGEADERQDGEGSGGASGKAPAPRRKALVLKGCTTLPSDAKARLRAAVLGR